LPSITLATLLKERDVSQQRIRNTPELAGKGGCFSLMGCVQRKWIPLPPDYQTGNGLVASRCRQYNCIRIKWPSNGIIITLRIDGMRSFEHISRFKGVKGVLRNDCLLVHDQSLRLKLMVVSLEAPLISAEIGSIESQYALVRCYRWVFNSNL
jgi:hypothetical protein